MSPAGLVLPDWDAGAGRIESGAEEEASKNDRFVRSENPPRRVVEPLSGWRADSTGAAAGRDEGGAATGLGEEAGAEGWDAGAETAAGVLSGGGRVFTAEALGAPIGTGSAAFTGGGVTLEDMPSA